jgi:hypothetical protein
MQKIFFILNKEKIFQYKKKIKNTSKIFVKKSAKFNLISKGKNLHSIL